MKDSDEHGLDATEVKTLCDKIAGIDLGSRYAIMVLVLSTRCAKEVEGHLLFTDPAFELLLSDGGGFVSKTKLVEEIVGQIEEMHEDR